MVRRIGSNDIEDFTSMEILLEASKRACRSRKSKVEVAEFLSNRNELLEALQASLRDGTYRSSEYRMFYVRENGKIRLVADLPLYPDRIAHWAVALAIEERMNSKLIGQTYASIPGRGAHQAVRQLQKYMQDSRVRFALQVDVSKFFPSMDKTVLKGKLRTVLKDKPVLKFLDTVIDDYDLPGIPIGNRTSPMFANLYLSEMDHVLKERHHVHYYVRYMDDIVVLGYSKPWLHRIHEIMTAMLSEIGLTIKGNWQIYPISARGVDFVGYVTYPTHILLRKRTKIRMKRAVRRISEHLDTVPTLSAHDRGTLASYNGVLKWCDSYHLRQMTLEPLERKISMKAEEAMVTKSAAYFFNSLNKVIE